MQVIESWTPPVGALGRLLAEAERRVDALRAQASALRARAPSREPAVTMADALRTGGDVRLIAEIKRSSPSRGVINPAISAGTQARAYADGGAAAISVLTEPTHFGGSTRDLEDVRAGVDLPILKKDFHINAVQFVEARAIGATAVLVIVRAISPARLPTLLTAAADEGLECVVEVRDDAELDRALAAGARMIGVNNRDLETLEIDPETIARLIPKIPGDRVAIAESGIGGRRDVERAAATGADAVLVGSFLSVSPRPGDAVRELMGVARRSRGA